MLGATVARSSVAEGDDLGIELAPLPWLVSRLRSFVSASPVLSVCKDYRHINLGQVDVAFAFLSPAAMPALRAKACAEMRPGSVFVSLAFSAPGRAPDSTLKLAAVLAILCTSGERKRQVFVDCAESASRQSG